MFLNNCRVSWQYSNTWLLLLLVKNSQLSLRWSPSPWDRHKLSVFWEFRYSEMTERQHAGTNTMCPSYKGIHLKEMSVLYRDVCLERVACIILCFQFDTLNLYSHQTKDGLSIHGFLSNQCLQKPNSIKTTVIITQLRVLVTFDW